MQISRTSSRLKLRQGLLIVISGPSGAGKNSLVDEVRRLNPEIKYSLSVTTRPPRGNEIHGVDYYFVSQQEFQKMIQQGELLEWAKVYENYYGTPKFFVDQCLAEGVDVIMDLDIQGAAQLRKIYPNGVFVFLVPPDSTELSRRIHTRGTDSKESVDLRSKCVRDELMAATNYDYIIVNDSLENAASLLLSIIAAEKSKIERIELDRFIEDFLTSRS